MHAWLASSFAEHRAPFGAFSCSLGAAASGGRRCVLGSFVLALQLVGCTPIEKVSSKREPAKDAQVDFDDLWVAAGYPCAGRVAPLLVRVEQVDTTLTGISLMRSECTDHGDRVWRGTLPHAPILRSELPITFEVEVTTSTGKPSVRGLGTVVSADRMLLDVGSMPWIVTRAKTALDEVERSSEAAADGGMESGRDAGLDLDAASSDRAVPSRDAGARAQPASAGGPTRTARDWYCLSYEQSCTCVAGLGMSSDMCNTPKPSCCFELIAIGQPSCQCWPPDSEPCLTRETEAPGSTLVETCPPP